MLKVQTEEVYLKRKEREDLRGVIRDETWHLVFDAESSNCGASEGGRRMKRQN